MSEAQMAALDREELRALFAEELELPLEEVTDHAGFADDLGGDSLMAMALVMTLEKKYGVKLEETAINVDTTLEQIHELLEARRQEA